MKISYFPYDPDDNPYQQLFAGSLEAAGCQVLRIPPRKLFPLRYAAEFGGDLLQLDWPHDWYQGRNWVTKALKQLMYRDGLRVLRTVPVVWTAHNLRGHDSSDADYERCMIQMLLDVCDGVIVLSAASAALLRTEYQVPPKTAIQVVPHGHYIGRYRNTATRAEARRQLGLEESSRVILSLGRIQPYKGLEELVTVFGRVASAGDALLLAGRAVGLEYARHLHTVISAAARPGIRIELTDAFVPDDQLQVYFNACDVVALPFRRVLNSGSLLLAMSFGCPVVAPRTGSIPEVACTDAWFSYEPEDPSGLARAIRAALSHPNLSSLRSVVLDFTRQRYDWSDVGRGAVNLYSALLGRESAPV